MPPDIEKISKLVDSIAKLAEAKHKLERPQKERINKTIDGLLD